MKGLVLALALTIAGTPVLAVPPQQADQTPRVEYLFIGLVDRPGIYTWRENLTVREAIAAAGGRARGADPVAVFFRIPPDRTQMAARLDDLVRPRDVLFIPRAGDSGR